MLCSLRTSFQFGLPSNFLHSNFFHERKNLFNLVLPSFLLCLISFIRSIFCCLHPIFLPTLYRPLHASSLELDIGSRISVRLHDMVVQTSALRLPLQSFARVPGVSTVELVSLKIHHHSYLANKHEHSAWVSHQFVVLLTHFFNEAQIKKKVYMKR